MTPAPPRPDEPRQPAESPSEAAARRPRVLVAEDTMINQKVTARQLERLGCAVDAVANGLDAIAALRRVRYDLVLMDCQMPEMDGFAATRIIRHAEGNARHTPVVAMTASAQEADRNRCIAAGMDDYVTKPVSQVELAAMLEKWAKARP